MKIIIKKFILMKFAIKDNYILATALFLMSILTFSQYFFTQFSWTFRKSA